MTHKGHVIFAIALGSIQNLASRLGLLSGFLARLLLLMEQPFYQLDTSFQATEQRRKPERPPLDPYGVDEEVHQQPIGATEDEEDSEIL